MQYIDTGFDRALYRSCCARTELQTGGKMKKLILAVIVVLGLGTAFVGAALTVQAQNAPAQGK